LAKRGPVPEIRAQPRPEGTSSTVTNDATDPHAEPTQDLTDADPAVARLRELLPLEEAAAKRVFSTLLRVIVTDNHRSPA
jgi:hypothetical protein